MKATELKKIKRLRYKSIIYDNLRRSPAHEKLNVAKVVGGSNKKTALPCPYPETVSRSKIFKELLDEVIPDEMVLHEHRALFNKHRTIRQIVLQTTDDKAIQKATEGMENVSVIKDKERDTTLIIINEVDKQSRRDAIELAYKIKGHLSPQKIEIKRDLEDLTDAQLMALVLDNEEKEEKKDNE